MSSPHPTSSIQKHTPAHQGSMWGWGPLFLLIHPIKACFWHSRPSASRCLTGKASFYCKLQPISAQNQEIGEPTPFLDWFLVAMDRGEEEEGQREAPSLFWWKRLHSWLPSYPLAAHLLHLICSNFTELCLFRNPRQLHASLRPAAELIFGLSRCSVFHTETQNATHYFIDIFLWEKEKRLKKKKKLERKRYLNSLIMEPEEEVLDYSFL